MLSWDYRNMARTTQSMAKRWAKLRRGWRPKKVIGFVKNGDHFSDLQSHPITADNTIPYNNRYATTDMLAQ